MIKGLALVSYTAAQSNLLSQVPNPMNYTWEGNTVQGATNRDSMGNVKGNYTVTNNGGMGPVQTPYYTNVNYKVANDWSSGKVESISKVSNYLWFALDSWGRANSGSPQPQCSTAQQCGTGANSRKNMCCAGISMFNKTADT